MEAHFEIVSLRQTIDDSLWLALILEGERLAQFRFAGPARDEDAMRALIYGCAAAFAHDTPALDQFRALERPRASGSSIRRVVDVSPPLAAAA